MTQNNENNKRDPKQYIPPQIEVVNGLTYGKWGNLALIYGVNAPFLSRLSRGYKDEHGCLLWSSPTLVLTLAEASNAFRQGDEARNLELIKAAVAYCNTYLDKDSQLPLDTRLRLTWARNGVVSVTCEQNRQRGYFMDVVKHGPETEIIIAPRVESEAPIRSIIPDDLCVFFPTGEDKPRRNNKQSQKQDA